MVGALYVQAILLQHELHLYEDGEDRSRSRCEGKGKILARAKAKEQDEEQAKGKGQGSRICLRSGELSADAAEGGLRRLL